MNIDDLNEALLIPDINIVIVCDSMNNNPFRDPIFYKKLQERFGLFSSRFNRTNINLVNGSRIYVLSYKSKATRGLHPNILIWSNRYLMSDNRAIIENVLPMKIHATTEKFWDW